MEVLYHVKRRVDILVRNKNAAGVNTLTLAFREIPSSAKITGISSLYLRQLYHTSIFLNFLLKSLVSKIQSSSPPSVFDAVNTALVVKMGLVRWTHERSSVPEA
jgi:hypothetical protein